MAVCGFDSPCDYVAYSDDGTSWATTSAAVSGLWGGLAYGNSLFVAVPIYDDTYTATTSLMTSSDGITWTKRTGVEANQWEAVTYGNGLYVAVANNGTNRVMTSSDGVTWTAHSAAGDDDAWTSVAYGNGLYVAVGAGDNAGGGDTFMTSPDGINWTTRLAPHPTIWNGISITYGNGLFVATARTNNIIMTSPDGVNWTVRLDSTNLGAFAGADVVFGNGLIVGVSYDTSMSFPADFPIVLSGTSTQDLSGNLTGASALPALIMKDAGTKTFLVNASTTDITIATSSGNVTAPAAISISGSLTNGSTFIGDEVMYVGSNLTNTGTTTAPTDLYVTGNLANTNILASSDNIYLTGNLTNSGTLTTSNNVYLGGNFDNSGTFTAPTNFYFNGNNQTATGTMTGISALNNVTLSSISSSTKTFTTNASTSNLTIISGTAFSAPGEISVSGDYNNNGTSSYVGAPWTARNAVGNDDNWYSVTYGNGLFVAVGEGSGGDYVMTSPDGATWTGRTAVVTNLIWRSVTYGNGLFVAVPYSDLSNAPTTTLMTSPDGITWTARTASEASYWRAITYGNGLFVVVAGGGTNRVMTSPDGSNWTSRSAAGDDDQWTGVTYGNGLFVAVGETNGVNDAVMTSPDGINWTVRSAADNNDYWFSITYAKDLFVAVGQPQGGDVVITSPDGITWTARSAADNNDYWAGVTYGNGLFVATNDKDFGGPNSFMTSSDGITWTADYLDGVNNSWFSAAFGNSTFVAVGNTLYGAFNPIMTSPVWSTTTFSGTTSQSISGNLNGASSFGNVSFSGAGTKTFATTSASTTNFTVRAGSGEVIAPEKLSVRGDYINNSTTTMAGATWIARDASEGSAWASLAYGDGLFVAVAWDGTNRVMTSPDGINWTSRTAAEINNWESVTYGNGLFVAVADSGTSRVMTSVDGINWDAQVAAEANEWRSVVFGNGLFVAVAQSGTNRVMTSPDGVTWTAQAAAEANSWYSVTYGNGLFVAISLNGTNQVMTSPDGITWTAQAAAEANSWREVTYGNGLFVAVSSDGTNQVMTSPDGITWTSRNAAEVNSWYAVTYGNGLFVAVGDTGPNRIMTSPDGIKWTSYFSNSDTFDFYTGSIKYGNGMFVVVSVQGANQVMTSSDTTLYLTGDRDQVISGSLTGASSLKNVLVNTVGTTTIANTASTTNLTIATSSKLVLPTYLSLAGNYQNNGTLNASGTTVYLSGSNPQTLEGTMTATSSFYNLILENNSRIGTTTFNNALTVGNTFTAKGGTYVALKSGATTTVTNLTLSGASTTPIYFGATATSSQSNFVLTGSDSVSYTNISNSNACGSTGGVIDVSTGNNTDGGNTSCWTFANEPATGSSTISLAESYTFYIGQSTTTLSTITISDAENPTITTTNDIRLSIATSTTNFRFNTNITTPTFGGTASGKVSGTVSYEDAGATLLITVTENFTANNTLTISGIEVGSFGSVSSTTSRLALHTDGDSAGIQATLSTETFRITGLITVSDHDVEQADNMFSPVNKTEVTVFAFKLTPVGENATVTDTVITLSGIQGITAEKLHTFKLYRDNNADLSLDGGDTLLDNNGIMTINGQQGAITFSTDFLSTTTKNYILIANITAIERGDAIVFSLPVSGIAAGGEISSSQPQIISTVSNIQHERYGAGSGGGGPGRVGGEGVAGAGTVGGGGSGGGGGVGQIVDGENISPDPDFARPSGTGPTDNEWTNPGNAYSSDGTYATAASTYRQSYINFGFNIPLTNIIQGISVKLDASGSTAAGTIDVALSWDNGASYTTGKATPSLAGSDIVYTVGGASDTWGRAWTAGEFSTENFSLRVTAAPASNTLRLDALEIRVHHQAGGGGGGGGVRI